MISVRSLLAIVLLAVALTARAQSTVPAATQALPNQTLATGDAATTLDLRSFFGVPGVSGQVVQFDTVLGKFNVMMRADAAPRHVANFLAYAQNGSYRNSFFHRSAAFEANNLTSIVQGGGYRAPLPGSVITKFSPVSLEYNLPNARGTLAAARTSDVNSATSEWFFNVRDNSTILGPGNGGGYSVFGQVIGTGMTVVDAIAAIPFYNVTGTVFTALPVHNLVGSSISDANLIVVNNISPIQVYPGAGTSLIQFSVQNSAPNVVTAALTGSSLSLTPVSGGTADVTVTATDVNGNAVPSTFTVTVSASAAPVFTTQPTSQAAAPGSSATITTAASGAAPGTFQWQFNGTVIAGATDPTLTIPSVQPANTGIYLAQVSTSGGTAISNAAILGVTSTTKLVGPGQEFPDIFHPGTGFTYDQILLGGAAASMKADSELGQILRVSFIDLNDDIVQVEFSGPGTLSLVLDAASGPALPIKYNQNTSYMKGHAGIVLTGANVNTNLTVFSVGRAIPGSNPALYKSDVTYDGIADIAFIAITSTDGKFGGLRAANASLFAAKGYTGVYAPGVQFTGPTFVGDINAGGEATPVFILGSSTDVRITGGDLLQNNTRAVQVSGITQLKFTAGSDSHGNAISAKTNQARLEQGGVDVTNQIVVNP